MAVTFLACSRDRLAFSSAQVRGGTATFAGNRRPEAGDVSYIARAGGTPSNPGPPCPTVQVCLARHFDMHDVDRWCER